MNVRGQEIPEGPSYRGRVTFYFPSLYDVRGPVAPVALLGDSLVFNFGIGEEVYQGATCLNGIPYHTPWGNPHSIEPLASGIIEYTTATHGGLWLDDDKARHARQLFDLKISADGLNWFEEDILACCALLAHVRLLPYDIAQQTVRAAKRHLELIEGKLQCAS